MKKKNRLQMLAALLAATLSMALTSPIAAKANEEYNVDTTKESNADTGRIYYLKNSHGDVIGQMDENGNVLTSYAYNAFGEQVSAVVTKGEQKSTSNRFLYAGEQYDETSGFYYLRARHYDVKAGRFTQEDTYLGDGRNLYAYVHSNPLKYVDPTGHTAAEIFDDDDSLLDDLEDKSIDGAKGNSGTSNGGGITVNLSYKSGWSETQKAQADAKVQALSNATTVKTTVSRGGSSAATQYASTYGTTSIPQGYDIDHTIDLQLGGTNDISNMSPLDMSVNRSLGAQIQHAISAYPVGTEFGQFIIK